MWRRLSSLRFICLKYRQARKPAPHSKAKTEILSHKHWGVGPPHQVDCAVVFNMKGRWLR